MQAEILKKANCDMSKIIIGHVGDTMNFDYVEKYCNMVVSFHLIVLPEHLMLNAKAVFMQKQQCVSA